MPVDSKYVADLERKVVSYVGATQPRLEKLAGYEAGHRRFVKRAAQCVGTLVGLGLVDRSKASGLIDKMAADSTAVFDVLESLAPSVRRSEIGSESSEKSASVERDPFVEVFGSNKAVGGDGMID